MVTRVTRVTRVVGLERWRRPHRSVSVAGSRAGAINSVVVDGRAIMASVYDVTIQNGSKHNQTLTVKIHAKDRILGTVVGVEAWHRQGGATAEKEPSSLTTVVVHITVCDVRRN